MMTLFFNPEPVVDWTTAARCDTQRYARYFWGMIERGVYLPCSQYEANFVSVALTDADLDKVPDPNGEYVNLTYPTALGGAFTVRSPGSALAAQTGSATSTNGVSYTYTTDPNARDAQGIPFTGQVHMQGVIYVAGTWEMTGNLLVFGSVVTRKGMAGTSTGSPDIYFDERLIKGQWPPAELNLPRTTLSFSVRRFA